MTVKEEAVPSTTELIQAPPSQVWDLVADVTRMGEWSPETRSAEWVGGATGPAVGARFKGHNKRKVPWSTTCTVTECDRGKVFAFIVGKGEGETGWRYDFAPAGEGECRVTESFDIIKVPGRVGKWLYKVGAGVPWPEREADLVRGMQETLRRLKAGAETTVR
jgi:uncharacterized protein YndB with AHSA1/START domain